MMEECGGCAHWVLASGGGAATGGCSHVPTRISMDGQSCFTRASVNAEGVSAALSGGTGRHGRPQGVLNRLRTLGRRVTTVQAHCKGHRPPQPAPLVGATGHYSPEVCWVLPGLLNRLRTLGRRVTTVWRSIGSAIDRWNRLRTLGRRVTTGSPPAGTGCLRSWLIGLGVIQACARS